MDAEPLGPPPTRPNPWLTIPLGDYEAHMACPAVGQLQVLSELTRATLAELRPPSLAVLGCAAGNGLEHVDPAVTRRVLAVDINPAYLAVTRERFAERLPGLQLVHADLGGEQLTLRPVHTVLATLLFEYVPLQPAVRNVAVCLQPGGYLVAGLQGGSTDSQPVTPTAWRSLTALAETMRLVAPEELRQVCATHGLTPVTEERISLRQGKALLVCRFRRATDGPGQRARGLGSTDPGGQR